MRVHVWTIRHVRTNFVWGENRCSRCGGQYQCGCNHCVRPQQEGWMNTTLPLLPLPTALLYCMLMVRARFCPTLPRELLVRIINDAWCPAVREEPLRDTLIRTPCCGFLFHLHCLVFRKVARGTSECSICKRRMPNSTEVGHGSVSTWQVRDAHYQIGRVSKANK